MEEMPNSDSPDPLSSTPPRPSRFLVAPSVPSTTASTPAATTNDHSRFLTRSPTLDSTPDLRARTRPRQSSLGSSSSIPSISLASMSSSSPRNDDWSFPDFGMDATDEESSLGEGNHGAADEQEQDQEEESLFVNDDDDISHGRVERRLGRLSPSWHRESSDDSFEENQILDMMAAEIDELVQMEVIRPGTPRGHQRHGQRPRAEPEVIDLTGDNDSPTQPGHQTHSQNARRQRSQQRNAAPRLSRSDANYMGSNNVILISDSDDEDPVAMPPPRRSNPPRPHSTNHEPPRNRPQAQPQPQPQPQPRDPARPAPPAFTFGHAYHTYHELVNLPVFRILQGSANMDNRDEDEPVFIGHRPVVPNALPAPNLPPINLDYLAHPFANRPHVYDEGYGKPRHEPPKDTREGFTRNTGEDVIAICPSCELELAYDPDDDEASQGPPTKKVRTKKDKAEHHFWAVKACGHVYCKTCYESRKSTGRNAPSVGFRRDPNGPKNHVLCAVEDCNTDVSAKSAWVGIFM